MKIAVIDDERPARKELVHQIMEAGLPLSTVMGSSLSPSMNILEGF